MKFFSALIFPAIAIAAAVPGADIEARADLPGLNAAQSPHARDIVAQAKKDGVGAHGCQIAIAYTLAESGLLNLANKAVPDSLKYPNDGTASDHDRIGVFQISAARSKSVKCDMEAACSANLFFSNMKKIRDWQTKDVAVVCQEMLISGPPTRFAKFKAEAVKVCATGF
ncbi:hypothetical protein NLG97_g8597 [Lecanicillium saksenae]|uniref:Uncharacterized protein n=1 Tax=Lecanicillium saksenae TaxID=468837 RepID=A0ACC1QIF8_9HYPO|nr:hypothetical protein NLG97_g8597 [Lecanicillium saksenae]